MCLQLALFPENTVSLIALTNGVAMNRDNPRINFSRYVERVGDSKRDDDATKHEQEEV